MRNDPHCSGCAGLTHTHTCDDPSKQPQLPPKPGNAEPCGYGVFWLEHNNHPCSVLYATENEALAFAARLGIVGSVEPVYRHPAQQGQEGRALAIVRVLACTPPDEWLSKKEIHEELAEFRGQS